MRKRSRSQTSAIGFNSDAELPIAHALKAEFEKFGFSVLFNIPYAGAIKPEGVEIKSVMLEVNIMPLKINTPLPSFLFSPLTLLPVWFQGRHSSVFGIRSMSEIA